MRSALRKEVQMLASRQFAAIGRQARSPTIEMGEAGLVKAGRGHPGVTKRRRTPLRIPVTDLMRFLEGGAIESLAEESQLTPREIVESLPAAMRRIAPPSAFVKVMNSIATWGDVAVQLQSPDGAVEFTGTLPVGKLSHGYYYWVGDGPIRGRLRHDRCGGIAFVERPHMGQATASVFFFNVEGGLMLKIRLPRDQSKGPQDEQLKAMRALAKRVCRTARG